MIIIYHCFTEINHNLSMNDKVHNRFIKFYNELINVLIRTELGTFKWDILNPDRLINLEKKNKRITSII